MNPPEENGTYAFLRAPSPEPLVREGYGLASGEVDPCAPSPSYVGTPARYRGVALSSALLEPEPWLRNVRCRPYCLGFRNITPCGPAEVVTRVAQPAVPFRISGLLVWGATKDTLIVRCQVGNVLHVLGSEEPVPALFFSTGLSFSELLASVTDDDGEPLPVRKPHGNDRFEPLDVWQGWLAEHPKVEPRQLFDFNTLDVGTQVALTTTGPLYQLVFWGLGLDLPRGERP